MTRHDTPTRIEGDDTEIVKHQQEQIRQLQEELAELKKERNKLEEKILKQATDLDEVPKLREELAEKDGQIQELVVKVAELRAATKTQGKPPPLVQSRQITDALAQVQRDIEGCFDEWAERAHLEQPKGAGLPVARDADLVVRLAVTPDGVGHDVTAKGHDSPSVRLCIETALTRVSYPKGNENLQVQVAIAWTGGNLSMTGHVVGRSEAQGVPAADF